jgi:hypothetical protein
VVWGDSKRKQHNEWDHKVNHSIINMRTQPTSDNLFISTTNDKKLNQAKQIYAIAGQFTDATGVLEDLCAAVCDRDYSRSKLFQDVAFVKKFVIPLLKDSINTITTAARILSPIAGVKFVHDRNKNKRKLEVAMFKNLSYSLPKESEVVNIMSKVPVGHVHSRDAMIKVILEHQKKYNVPCSQANIYRVMANHAKGLIISGDFKGGGRPPICSDTDLKRIAESLDEEVGKTYDKSDVKTMI